MNPQRSYPGDLVAPPLNNLPRELGDNRYTCPSTGDPVQDARCQRKMHIAQKLYKDTSSYLGSKHHRFGYDFRNASDFYNLIKSNNPKAKLWIDWLNAPPCSIEARADFKTHNLDDKHFVADWTANIGGDGNLVWTGTTCQSGWLGQQQPFQVRAPVCQGGPTPGSSPSWPVITSLDDLNAALDKRWDKVQTQVPNPYYGQCSILARQTLPRSASGSCDDVAAPRGQFYSLPAGSVKLTPQLRCICDCLHQGGSPSCCEIACKGAFGVVTTTDSKLSIDTTPWKIDGYTCVKSDRGEGVYPTEAACKQVLNQCKTPTSACYVYDKTTDSCNIGPQFSGCPGKLSCCQNHPGAKLPDGTVCPGGGGNTTAEIVGGIIVALIVGLVIWRLI